MRDHIPKKKKNKKLFSEKEKNEKSYSQKEKMKNVREKLEG